MSSIDQVNPPNLPPLYFAQKEEQQRDHEQTTSSSSSCCCSSTTMMMMMQEERLALTLLPSEVLCNIVNFLDWGEYARLSATCHQFSSMVHDAATTETKTMATAMNTTTTTTSATITSTKKVSVGNSSDSKNESDENSQNPKWDLALALLNGTNGLAQNPSRAIQYLQDLARLSTRCHGDVHGDGDCDCDVREDEYEPSHQPTMQVGEACASLTSTQAMKKLAKCYLTGAGIPTNLQKGLAWLKKAYYHGDVDAAYDIATIYEYSKYSVPVDIYAAASWFHAGASSGHVECMAEYAMCLELGCGVEQSDDGALDWYTKAAEGGHMTSHYSVGEMFEMARGGLPQSDTEAVLWYYKAAMMGCDDSVSALKRLSDIARIVLPGWAATLNE